MDNLKQRVDMAMKARGLVWLDKPAWSDVTTQSAVTGKTRMISGRIGCNATGLDAWVGPHLEEHLFWEMVLQTAKKLRP